MLFELKHLAVLFFMSIILLRTHPLSSTPTHAFYSKEKITKKKKESLTSLTYGSEYGNE